MTDQSVKIEFVLPKIVNKELKRQEILDAAIETFVERGISNTRMTDIAIKANIGKGTIYEYFKNRDDILVSTVFAMNNGIGDIVREKIANVNNPIEKIDITINVLLSSLQNMRKDMLALSFQLNAEAMKNETLMNLCTKQYSQTFDEFYTFLKATLNEGIELKLFKKHNVDVVARMIMALVDGAIYHSIALDKWEKLNEWFHDYVETMMNMIKNQKEDL